MAFSAADVAQLELAIKQGLLRVQYADRLVQYDSLDAMWKARRRMLDEAAAASGQPRRRRMIRLTQTGMGR
jgi:hypothetical protein